MYGRTGEVLEHWGPGAVGAAVTVGWLLTGSWVYIDVIGCSSCVLLICVGRLPSLQVATVALCGLLARFLTDPAALERRAHSVHSSDRNFANLTGIFFFYDAVLVGKEVLKAPQRSNQHLSSFCRSGFLQK